MERGGERFKCINVEQFTCSQDKQQTETLKQIKAFNGAIISQRRKSTLLLQTQVFMIKNRKIILKTLIVHKYTLYSCLQL